MRDRRILFIAVLMALFAVLPLVAGALDQEFYIGQVRRVLIYAIAAVSLDLIVGYGGMVSLGHAAFLGIGAYVVGILAWHADREVLLFGLVPGTTNGVVAVVAAVVVGAGFAAVIGAVSLRTTGLYFIMITLAFAQMLYFLMVSLRFEDQGRAYGGDDGLRFPVEARILGLVDPADDVAFYYLVLAMLALVLVLGHRLVNARFGLVLQGLRDNERRMRAIGFSPFACRLAAFTLAGAVTGLAGALLAYHEAYVSPAIMHWTRSGDLVVMVVLGGLGTLFGPVAGAAAFLLLEKFLPDYTEHWMLVFGPILVAVVLFAKRGLIGLAEGRNGGTRDGR
ncbi:MAG: branched-chain amino acid ABC transporter permease [Alphaproteobacteria bacterium]|nr:branched-chain amino acid ABC transporter permease [Alphaproteobacteria bacterium]